MNSLTVYRASAGSGKTFTLAVEYVKLLVLYAGGKEFAHILAVTFTNKATTEMKSRILAHLYGVGGTDEVLPSSRDFFNKLKEKLHEEPGFSASDEEIRHRCRWALQLILHDYSHFRVQTIDAFFQSILRGLAHELGLTASLQVDISDTEVLSEAVDRIIDRLQDEPEVQTWLFSLIQEQIENNQRWDVTREVKGFGRAIFNETYLRQGDLLREVLADKKRLSAFIDAVRKKRDDAVARLKSQGNSLCELLRQKGVTYDDFSNGKTLATFVRDISNGDFGVKIGTRITGWADDPISMVRKSDRSDRSDLLDVADAVSSLLDETLELLPSLSHDYNSAQLALRHIKPLRLLDFIDREVATINAENSRFNLAKTPIFLNRMIGQDDAPFIFEKTGALLHHIMIDEFQDTSRLQWENFFVLLMETFSRGGRNLIVGDVKQSIYRWRGGDWRMLGFIDKEVTPDPRVIPLDTNFRSSTRVINFNNAFFRSAADLLDVATSADEQLLGIERHKIHDDPAGDERGLYGQAYGDVRQQPRPGKAESGYVCVTAIDTTAEPFKESDALEEWILNDLCERVRSLIDNGVPENKITILVRWNREIPPILAAFAATEGMPKVVSDEAFLLGASPAIQLLIAALRVIDDPEEPVATEFLRVHAPDFEPASLPDLPLYELLEHLYAQLDVASVAGQDAYLFGFFDAVTDYLRDGQADVHSFLAYWDETLSAKAIPAGRSDGIRILTIHKSKGLEFHTVVVPFCSWPFEGDRWDSLLWCTPSEAPYSDLGLLSAFERDYVEEHVQARLDELNALYVAFTRAEDNLFVWAPYGKQDAAPKTVGDLTAVVLPGLDVWDDDVAEGVRCYFDGELVVPERKVTDTQCDATPDKQASDETVNRMKPEFGQIAVHMVSHEGLPQFRQSNSSQQFVRQAQADAAPDAEDEAILLEQCRQQEYIDTGLLLHSLFQQIATTADIARVLMQFESDGLLGSDGVSRQDLCRIIDRALQNPQVARWFDGSWELYTECGIACIDPKLHQPVTRRPDRVMLSSDHSEAVVVDFKFGRPHEGYEEQVQTYMNLIAQMYPQATVCGYLWYVLKGKVFRV